MTTIGEKARNMPALVLASGSPRRQELLRQLGMSFRVVVPEVDETPRGGESGEDFVARLALDKAGDGSGLAVDLGLVNVPVLGADTCIVLDDEIIGKPRNRDHGVDMLHRLAGRTHHVFTGIAVIAGKQSYSAISHNLVTFAPLSREEIADYWETGEPADKAGAYAIQGKAAAFIERIEGSYSGIVGLPLYELARILKQLGKKR